MTRTVDFLVVGSGIAGLSFALKAAKHGKVLIVTKANEDESNTKYAQGGVAVVVDKKEDSFEKHINDTLIAGDGLCDPEVVEAVVKEGPERIREIIDYGTNFDKTNEGIYDLQKKVAIANLGYYIIRISPDLRLKDHYWKRSIVNQILKY
jgi:L-aspartate oxidase